MRTTHTHVKIVSATLALAALVMAASPGRLQDKPPDATFTASYARGHNADSSSGSPEATLHGEARSEAGLADPAIVVGPRGWLQYALAGNINQDDVPGSVEMWIKPLDWDGASRLCATLFVADYDNTGRREGDQGIFRLYTQGNGRLTFIAGPYPQDDARRQVWAQTDIGAWPQGEWRHVVATWDGVDIALYVDGEQRARNRINIISGGGEDPRFKPTLGKTFTVGGSPWGDTGETAVDEVTIYRKALRPQEVMQRYQRKSGLIARGGAAPAAEPEAALPLPVGTGAPTLDGTIAAGEWDDASSTNVFLSLLAPEIRLWPFGNRLFCKLISDKLYLGLASQFNRGQAPVAEFESHSSNVFQDDCFEVFLSTGRDENAQVYQLVVNSRGSLDVYRSRPKSTLIETRIRAAAAVSEDTWSAELEVPLSELVEPLPERLFLQVSRSYKYGTLAERTQRQASLSKEPIEEYAGFPWNDSFLNLKHFAELTVAPAGQGASCQVDTPALLTGDRLVVQGKAEGLQATWQGVGASPEPITSAADGSFTYDRQVPEDASAVRLSARDLHLTVPLARVPALVLKHTIYSFSDTLEATVETAGMAAPPEGLTAELCIRAADGKALARKSLAGIGTAAARHVFSLAGLPPGQYVLECAVPHASQPDGVARARQAFQVFRGLPGGGRFDHLVAEVPTPWTPVQVKPNAEIGVWGRTYRFGKQLLPTIIAQGQPLLAAAPRYDLQLTSGEPFSISDGAARVIEREPAHCTLRTTGGARGVSIRQLATVEYDGMMRFDVEVESREPITRLSLVVPYLPERAEVFQPSYFRGKWNRYEMDALEITPEFSWASEYLEPAIFISDMDAGLSWFAATDRTWLVDEGRKKIEVTKHGFVVTFINTEKDAPRRLSFTYGLQAFPTKPPREDWREFGRVRESKWISVFVPDNVVEQAVDGQVAPEYFTKILPDLAPVRRLRGLLLPYCNFPRSVEEYTGLEPETQERAVKRLYETLDQVKASGFEYVIPYLSPTYATHSIPEWQYYWSNWTAIPKHVFESYGQPAVSPANKQWADFWLHSFEKFVKQYGIKGVFHDMACPYAEEGTLNGLGYDRNGVRYPEYPTWELRDLYKKVYVLHRKLYPDAMSFMNYGVYTPAVHSFADFLLMAERYETRADRSVYDWDGDGNIRSFRYQGSLPFGPRAMHNGWLKYPLAMNEKGPTVHMYGVVLLHDLIQWNINEHPEVRQGIHEMKKRVGIGYDRSVEFLPYWKHGDACRMDNKDVVVSFYRRGQSLLAILANTRMKETYSGAVTLDLRKLGLDRVQGIELYDPMDNSYTPLQNEGGAGTVTVNVEVQPTLFKALLLN